MAQSGGDGLLPQVVASSKDVRFVDQDEPLCKVLAAALQQVAPQLLSQVGFSITLGTVFRLVQLRTQHSWWEGVCSFMGASC